MNKKEQYLVNIYCQNCGEKFTLKGRMKDGKVETGFKRCLCDNDRYFEVQSEKVE